jgi:predicted DCC family thiol-disulfide oxidoreductase YuxK
MIPTDMARDATRWTVLYDRDCGWCKWSLASLLTRDRERRLRPLALGTPEADELLSDLTPEQRNASWHLISPSGERTSAGAALPELLRLLPRGDRIASVLARFPGATERGYWFIANNRSKFSKLIPADAKQRATASLERRGAALATDERVAV